MKQNPFVCLKNVKTFELQTYLKHPVCNLFILNRQ